MWAFVENFIARLSSKTLNRSLSFDGEQVVYKDPANDAEQISFAWADVEEILTYKLDLVTYDTICLAFRVGSEWHEFREEDEGFLLLLKAIESRYPSVPQDWYFKVMQPPFATCERVLWRR